MKYVLTKAATGSVQKKKKVALKIFPNFSGKHLCWSLL